MAKRTLDPSVLSQDDRQALARFEEMIRAMNRKRLLEAPQHIRQLGKILRRSVLKETTVKLRRFLKEHNIRIRRADLEAFRDYLIIHRIDLKDLEPAARDRLRIRTLAREDPRRMSRDYRDAVNADGVPPRCRDCRWFVRAPNDGDPNGDKSCVELGTKGIDVACYGFTVQAN